MESPRKRLEQHLFTHLDADLPVGVKKKLHSTDVRILISSVVNFIRDNPVLLDMTPPPPKPQRPSRFAPVHEDAKDFIGDLSKI